MPPSCCGPLGSLHPMRQQHRTLIAVAAAALLMSACSGSEGDSDAAAASTAPVTTALITAESPVTAPPTTSAGEGAYCLLRREVDLFSDSVDESELADPELARQFFAHQLTLVEQSVGVAPPELAADIDIYVTATNGVIAELESNDFNVLTADLSAFDTPEIVAARQRLRDYDTAVCSIPKDPEDSSEDSSGFDLGAGPIVDQFVASLVEAGFTDDEARCVFDQLDFADPGGLTDATIGAAFVACGIDEARLEEIGL